MASFGSLHRGRSQERPSSAASAERDKLPAIEARPLSSSACGSAGRRGSHRVSAKHQELTLVPIANPETGAPPAGDAKVNSAAAHDQRGKFTENDHQDDLFSMALKRDRVLADLKQQVDRLERDLKLTSELLRQSNKELTHKDATISHLNRQNDRLRSKVIRLESDVAVYKASAATSSEEDEQESNEHACCAKNKELLKTLTGIFSKMNKTEGQTFHKDSERVPDAKLLEQVFAKFWQDYRSISGELETCKKMVAFQELKIKDLEDSCKHRSNISQTDSRASEERTAAVQRLANLHCGLEVSQPFLLIDDLQNDYQGLQNPHKQTSADAVSAQRGAVEKANLQQCINRLQLDNNRLLMLNREISMREVATKNELQRVQSKLSSFKSDLSRATKKILGRESSCTFPAEVSLEILLDELVALRRQNVRLKSAQQQQQQQQQQQHHHHQQEQQQQQQVKHHQDKKQRPNPRDLSRGGLQPVPEEASDWTSATWAGVDVTETSGGLLRRDNSIHAVREGEVVPRSGLSNDRVPAAGATVEDVSASDYRIWFPQADPRPPEERRTYSEYRYTEHTKGDVTEKTISVEQVFEKNAQNVDHGHEQTSSLESVRCATTPGGYVQISHDKVHSIAQNELREHGSQLSRMDAFLRVPQVQRTPSTCTVVGNVQESKPCQMFYESSSGSGKDPVGDMLTLKPPSLESEEEEFEVLPTAEPPFGFQDASLISEDDEFDVRLSTYLKADNVDVIEELAEKKEPATKEMVCEDFEDMSEEKNAVTERSREQRHLEGESAGETAQTSDRAEFLISMVESSMFGLASHQDEATRETDLGAGGLNGGDAKTSNVVNEGMERPGSVADSDIVVLDGGGNSPELRRHEGIVAVTTNQSDSEATEETTSRDHDLMTARSVEMFQEFETIDEVDEAKQPTEKLELDRTAHMGDAKADEELDVSDKNEQKDNDGSSLSIAPGESLEQNETAVEEDLEVSSDVVRVLEGQVWEHAEEGSETETPERPQETGIGVHTVPGANGTPVDENSLVREHAQEGAEAEPCEGGSDKVTATPAVSETEGNKTEQDKRELEVVAIQSDETYKPLTKTLEKPVESALDNADLDNSMSASIEAHLLKDVMELNRNDDETSLDVSIQEDSAASFDSLPRESNEEDCPPADASKNLHGSSNETRALESTAYRLAAEEASKNKLDAELSDSHSITGNLDHIEQDKDKSIQGEAEDPENNSESHKLFDNKDKHSVQSSKPSDISVEKSASDTENNEAQNDETSNTSSRSPTLQSSPSISVAQPPTHETEIQAREVKSRSSGAQSQAFENGSYDKVEAIKTVEETVLNDTSESVQTKVSENVSGSGVAESCMPEFDHSSQPVPDDKEYPVGKDCNMPSSDAIVRNQDVYPLINPDKHFDDLVSGTRELEPVTHPLTTEETPEKKTDVECSDTLSIIENVDSSGPDQDKCPQEEAEGNKKDIEPHQLFDDKDLKFMQSEKPLRISVEESTTENDEHHNGDTSNTSSRNPILQSSPSVCIEQPLTHETVIEQEEVKSLSPDPEPETFEKEGYDEGEAREAVKEGALNEISDSVQTNVSETVTDGATEESYTAQHTDFLQQDRYDRAEQDHKDRKGADVSGSSLSSSDGTSKNKECAVSDGDAKTSGVFQEEATAVAGETRVDVPEDYRQDSAINDAGTTHRAIETTAEAPLETIETSLPVEERVDTKDKQDSANDDTTGTNLGTQANDEFGSRLDDGSPVIGRSTSVVESHSDPQEISSLSEEISQECSLAGDTVSKKDRTVDFLQPLVPAATESVESDTIGQHALLTKMHVSETTIGHEPGKEKMLSLESENTNPDEVVSRHQLVQQLLSEEESGTERSPVRRANEVPQKSSIDHIQRDCGQVLLSEAASDVHDQGDLVSEGSRDAAEEVTEAMQEPGSKENILLCQESKGFGHTEDSTLSHCLSEHGNEEETKDFDDDRNNCERGSEDIPVATHSDGHCPDESKEKNEKHASDAILVLSARADNVEISSGLVNDLNSLAHEAVSEAEGNASAIIDQLWKGIDESGENELQRISSEVKENKTYIADEHRERANDEHDSDDAHDSNDRPIRAETDSQVAASNSQIDEINGESVHADAMSKEAREHNDSELKEYVESIVETAAKRCQAALIRESSQGSPHLMKENDSVLPGAEPIESQNKVDPSTQMSDQVQTTEGNSNSSDQKYEGTCCNVSAEKRDGISSDTHSDAKEEVAEITRTHNASFPVVAEVRNVIGDASIDDASGDHDYLANASQRSSHEGVLSSSSENVRGAIEHIQISTREAEGADEALDNHVPTSEKGENEGPSLSDVDADKGDICQGTGNEGAHGGRDSEVPDGCAFQANRSTSGSSAETVIRLPHKNNLDVNDVDREHTALSRSSSVDPKEIDETCETTGGNEIYRDKSRRGSDFGNVSEVKSEVRGEEGQYSVLEDKSETRFTLVEEYEHAAPSERVKVESMSLVEQSPATLAKELDTNYPPEHSQDEGISKPLEEEIHFLGGGPVEQSDGVKIENYSSETQNNSEVLGGAALNHIYQIETEAEEQRGLDNAELPEEVKEAITVSERQQEDDQSQKSSGSNVSNAAPPELDSDRPSPHAAFVTQETFIDDASRSKTENLHPNHDVRDDDDKLNEVLHEYEEETTANMPISETLSKVPCRTSENEANEEESFPGAGKSIEVLEYAEVHDSQRVETSLNKIDAGVSTEAVATAEALDNKRHNSEHSEGSYRPSSPGEDARNKSSDVKFSEEVDEVSTIIFSEEEQSSLELEAPSLQTLSEPCSHKEVKKSGDSAQDSDGGTNLERATGDVEMSELNKVAEKPRLLPADSYNSGLQTLMELEIEDTPDKDSLEGYHKDKAEETTRTQSLNIAENESTQPAVLPDTPIKESNRGEQPHVSVVAGDETDTGLLTNVSGSTKKMRLGNLGDNWNATFHENRITNETENNDRDRALWDHDDAVECDKSRSDVVDDNTGFKTNGVEQAPLVNHETYAKIEDAEPHVPIINEVGDSPQEEINEDRSLASQTDAGTHEKSRDAEELNQTVVAQKLNTDSASTTPEQSSKDAELADALEKFAYLLTMDDDDDSLKHSTPDHPKATLEPETPIIIDVTDDDVIPEESTESTVEEPLSRDEEESDSSSVDKTEDQKDPAVESATEGPQPSLDKTTEDNWADDANRLRRSRSSIAAEDVLRSTSTQSENVGRNVVKSTTTFKRTIFRKESTRTVKKIRSLVSGLDDIQRSIPGLGDKGRSVSVEVPDVICAAQQAYHTMSVPRQGLSPRVSDAVMRSVAVQTTTTTLTERQVQTEFEQHDCVARLVELQIAMNEQEEVRRQDMKAACELVEKLEAMQISESLMRTQLEAMDSERKELGSKEARMKDELKAWQETVQQQQLLLQQLKEDLDDMEDALSAQRKESNRLREQLLVLQDNADRGIVVKLLDSVDKEVQTVDDVKHPLANLEGIRQDAERYQNQLARHRRVSALVSSQLEATATRIAQLKQEASVESVETQEYINLLTEKEALIQQVLEEQRQLELLITAQNPDIVREPNTRHKGQVLSVQTEEEKLSLVGARCLHENHPEIIGRQSQLLRRLQGEPSPVSRSSTASDRGASSGRADIGHRPYVALLKSNPVQHVPRSHSRTPNRLSTAELSNARNITMTSTSTTINSRSQTVSVSLAPSRAQHLKQHQQQVHRSENQISRVVNSSGSSLRH